MRHLTGRRVVVTRPSSQTMKIGRLLEEFGAKPVLVPTIAILPPTVHGPLDRALQDASKYEWIVFTSANGVRSVLGRCAVLGIDFSAWANIRLAAVGTSTAKTMEDAGLTVSAIPHAYRSDRLPDAMGDVEGGCVLLPRSDIADPRLPELLRSRGARVDAVSAYRTEYVEITADAKASLKEADAMTFTSPSSIRGLLKGLGSDDPGCIENTVVATVGPVTSDAARALGVRVDVEATESTFRGLVEALDHYDGWEV